MNHFRWMLLALALPLCGCSSWNLRGEPSDPATLEMSSTAKPFRMPSFPGFGTSKFGVSTRSQEIEESLGTK